VSAGVDRHLFSLLDALEAASSSGKGAAEETARVCGELQDLVATLRPSPQVLAAFSAQFSCGRGADKVKVGRCKLNPG
jgi:hypothetical protein